MNSKKILPALILSGALMLGAYSFAAETQTTKISKLGHQMMKHKGNFSGDVQQFSGRNMSGMNHDGFGVERFIDNSALSDDQKTALESLKSSHKESMKSVMDQFTGTLSDEQKQSLQDQCNQLKLSHFESLKPYISSDKLIEFEEFVEKSKSNSCDMNNHTNKNNGLVKNKNQLGKSISGFKYLKGTTYNSVKQKLEKMTTDKLNLLTSKLDNLIAQYADTQDEKKQLHNAIYSELRSLIDLILNETNEDETANLVESLLN